MKTLSLFAPLFASLAFTTVSASAAPSTSASHSTSHTTTRHTTTTTTTTATSSSPTIFSFANFTASAFYQQPMRYQADVVYEPDPNFSARCLKNTDTLTQCRNAPGLTPFNRISCDGPGGTNTDGRWYWRLNPANVSSTAGFNFEIELDAADISFIGRTLYACKFFPASAVKCNDSARGQTAGPPAAYLDVPRTFTVTAQTVQACAGDVAPTGTGTAMM